MNWSTCKSLCLFLCLCQRSWLTESNTLATEYAPLLPHFNEGFRRIMAEKGKQALVASLGSGIVEWRKDERIELCIDYYCNREKECHGQFGLNGSEKLVNIDSYSIGASSYTGKNAYKATVRLYPRRQYGFAIVTFRLMVMENLVLKGHISGQYLVNIKPPYKRSMTKGCNFKVDTYNKANVMIFTFNPNAFMPSGVKWQKFAVYKRISIEKPPVRKFIYVPLLVMARTPFTAVPLNFYYFKEVLIELGDNGRLLVRGNTELTSDAFTSTGLSLCMYAMRIKASGLNHHDSGMYTVRWYTYDRQHIVDEQCEDTSQVPFWSHPVPTSPIFAHTKRETPEEWSFDLEDLQQKALQSHTSALVACVWQDVFQSIPKSRRFTLVITRRAFYSEGEELGFMMYAYLRNFNKPSLDGYVCHTESMDLAGMRPYLPCPQVKDSYSVHPAVLMDGSYLRFTIRADYICREEIPEGFTGFTVSDGKARDYRAKASWNVKKDKCEGLYQSAGISLSKWTKWKQGGSIRFTIHKPDGNLAQIVLMDVDNRVTVTPGTAVYTQEVEISCFKNRFEILEKNYKVVQLKYIRMYAETGPNNYLQIASYTPESGYEVNTKNIDISAKLKRTNKFPRLILRAMAYHLHNFHGFRCRMKVNSEEYPEYEVVNTKPVCFVRRPPPIIMSVDNITVPIAEDESVLQSRNLQIYQTSCIQPKVRLVFTCSQWREMDTCDNLLTVDSIYNVDTDLIVYNVNLNKYTVRKPVFDRIGRGRVDILAVPYDWHIAEVTCHRIIHISDNASRVVIDQYSSAVRLCVTQLKFKFYLAHVGFDWTKGLTISFEEMARMQAVTELNIDKVNPVDVGSAIICHVTDNTPVYQTEIKQQNTRSEDDGRSVRIFSYENVSIAILLNVDNRKRNEYVTLFCQTKRKKSNISAKSESLRLTVREAILRDDGVDELHSLFTYLILTTIIGVAIAAICPLIAMGNERRHNIQKRKRQKEAARRLKRLNLLREMGLEKQKNTNPVSTPIIRADRINHGGENRDTESDELKLLEEIYQSEYVTDGDY